MRIGIYDPYLDDLGGGEKYMMKIAQCLSKEHNVDVFWDEKKDLEDLKKRFLLDLRRINLVDNIFSTYTSFAKRLSVSRKYDVIIALSDGSIPFLLSKKTFLHIQQPLPSGVLGFKSKLKLMKIKKIFCNSFYTKSYVDKSLGVDSFVLYPPVDLKPKKRKKENIILHVGRFRVRDVVTKKFGEKQGVGDYKKQWFMIDTFKKLPKEEIKNWKFVLAVSVRVEDREEFEELKKTADGHPVEFIVNKNNDGLWDYYSKAKVYWHASGFGEDLDNHPEYAEHFGISTVEAMGAGAVPIVIDAGGQKEIVKEGENGYLWSTQDEFIKKTVRVAKDDALLKKLSENAKKTAKIFAGDRFCNELYKILDL